MYYCSAFAPFTEFQKEHIEQLIKKDSDVTILFLNTSMNDLKTKLYMTEVMKELSVDLDYKQVDVNWIMALGELEGIIYFDQLVLENYPELVTYISEDVMLTITAEYGYELLPFNQTYIFDDISKNIAHYLFKNELFDVTRNMGLVFNNMSYKRFKHTMRVRYLIRKLAVLHDIDEETAMFTALFHDYAKEIPEEDQYAIMERYFQSYIDAPKATWHGFAGAILLEQLYGEDIIDDNIYEAIEFHPIGIPHYSKLGLALFIADFCDYRRPFKEETEKVWNLAQTSLYEAAIAKIESIQSYFNASNKTMYWTTENMLKWLQEL